MDHFHKMESIYDAENRSGNKCQTETIAIFS